MACEDGRNRRREKTGGLPIRLCQRRRLHGLVDQPQGISRINRVHCHANPECHEQLLALQGERKPDRRLQLGDDRGNIPWRSQIICHHGKLVLRQPRNRARRAEDPLHPRGLNSRQHITIGHALTHGHHPEMLQLYHHHRKRSSGLRSAPDRMFEQGPE